MNDRTNRLASLLRIMDEADGAAPPPNDELDGLLREWHREHAEIAAAKREEILAAIGGQTARSAPRRELSPRAVLATIGPAVRRALGSQFARAAACIALAALFATITLLPARHGAEAAIVHVAEGGELTAFTLDGDRLGPCPLQHTDVAAEVSGPVTRVNVRQTYANPYPQKIEATYTFPLSHRAAVDSMRITVRGADGVERIVEGEVKERDQARRMYEDARRAGYVASLLEQERRNIFTQSVANIEPGAKVAVEISYVEFLERRDGEYRFAFPMVVAPRYVPGSPSISGNSLPQGLISRAGVVLLAPAEVTVTSQNASLTGAAMQTMLVAALPVKTPTPEWMERPAAGLGQPIDFVVTYANGAKEPGQLFDGAAVGQVNGRWFFSPTRRSGTGFASDTNQVPDASRITPMPNKPAERAGHEVSLSVTIDAGGMALSDVNSELHEIVESTPATARRRTFELKSKSTIPNRDFVMSWHAKSGDANEIVGSGTLAHLRTAPDETAGGYFAVLVEPPARPTVDQVMPRELVFLVDVSGSMQGFPIEKSKEVIGKAIAAMRPSDTFNVITFAGNTQSLWTEQRTATDENRRLAREFVERQQGGGGTEMLPAIEAALKGQRDAGWMSFADLLNSPADGRGVRLEVPQSSVDQTKGTISIDSKSARVTFGVQLPSSGGQGDLALQLTGRWMTDAGDRVFVVDNARYAKSSIAPNRIVIFLTDGLIGNDGAIVDLVRQNAKSTRVFAFGIGNSVNRALLDGAATAGRGMAEFVTLPADADAAVARLTRRLESPVLVDIDVAFDNIEVSDISPALDRLPDLYDESPLVLVGRYVAKPGVGGELKAPSVTVRGRNANGPWERTIPIDLASATEKNTAVASLWARSKVDAISDGNEEAIAQGSLADPLRKEIVRLGERYRIMTPFTSFIAIEKSRVTVGGEPMLVQIPIELPEGMSWKGLFGEGISPAHWAGQVVPENPTISVRRLSAVTKLATLAESRQIAFAESADQNLLAQSLFFAAESTAARALEVVDRLEESEASGEKNENEDMPVAGLADSLKSAAPKPLTPLASATVQDRREARTKHRAASFEAKMEAPATVASPTGGAVPGHAASFGAPASPAGTPRGLVTTPSKRELHDSVPLLGDIPALGKSFRSDPTTAAGLLTIDPGSAQFRNAPEFNLSGSMGQTANGGFGGGFDDKRAIRSTDAGRDVNGDAGAWVTRHFVADPREMVEAIERSTRERLQAPITASFQSKALNETIDEVSVKSGVPFLVDWAKLSRLSISPSAPITVSVENVSATDALKRLLEQTTDRSREVELSVSGGVATVSATEKPGSPGGAAPGAPAPDQSSKAEIATSGRPDGGSVRDPAPAAPAPTAEPPAPAQPAPTPTRGAAPPPPAPVAEPPAPGGVATTGEGDAALHGGSKLKDPEPSRPQSQLVDASASNAALAEPVVAAKAAKPDALRALSVDERNLLARRVELQLLVAALAALLDEDLATELAVTSQPAIAVEPDRTVRISLLLADSDGGFEKGLDTLRENGVTIESLDRGRRLVIARTALKDVVSIALLNPVRRVEAFRGSPDQRSPRP